MTPHEIMRVALDLRLLPIPLGRIRIAVTEDEWKDMLLEMGKSATYLSDHNLPTKRLIIYGVELVQLL